VAKSKLAVTDRDAAISELASKSNHKTLAIWAADCAERVLLYFEEAYPGDNRLENAIEANRAWVHGELAMTEARKAAFAAHDAAREAQGVEKASAAARAAGHAAATAHVATHAVHAATYAATAVRDAAETDPTAAAREEREWQYQHLLVLNDS